MIEVGLHTHWHIDLLKIVILPSHSWLWGRSFMSEEVLGYE
jgi:hypothetical protein